MWGTLVHKVGSHLPIDFFHMCETAKLQTQKKKKKPKVCENHLFNLKEIKKQFGHVISGQNYPKSFIFDRLQKEKIMTAKIWEGKRQRNRNEKDANKAIYRFKNEKVLIKLYTTVLKKKW